MNGRQKEALQSGLKDEQAVLDSLTKNYTSALADIKRNIRELQSNPLTQSKAYQLEFQKQLEKQISGIIDNLQGKNFASVADYLQKAYTNGFVGNMYDLQGQGVPLVIPINQNQVLKAVEKTGDDFKLANKLGVSTKELKKQVQQELSRGFATELSYADIARNISDYGLSNMHRAMNIARTEGHRVQNTARMDSMQAAKDKGADIVKQWDSTLDGNTRPEHAELDGQVRELDEDFTVGSYSAPCPGMFGDPYMDCSCRCAMLQRARWAVQDESTYTKWNNETGGFIECSGYEDFKEKYILSSKTLKSSQSSGKINSVTSCKDFNELTQYMKSTFNIDVDSSMLSLNLNVVQQPLSGFETMAKTFPELANNTMMIKTSNSGVMACTGEKITFNPNYFSDVTKLADACRQYGSSGWWVKGATPESIGVHESAHGVEWVLCKLNPSYAYDWERIMAYNKCTEAQTIVGQACKNIKKTAYGKGKNNDWLKEQISRYAKDNPSETMAEAFADVYVNGGNANPLSLEIEKLTMELYKKYKGGVVI